MTAQEIRDRCHAIRSCAEENDKNVTNKSRTVNSLVAELVDILLAQQNRIILLEQQIALLGSGPTKSGNTCDLTAPRFATRR